MLSLITFYSIRQECVPLHTTTRQAGDGCCCYGNKSYRHPSLSARQVQGSAGKSFRGSYTAASCLSTFTRVVVSCYS